MTGGDAFAHHRPSDETGRASYEESHSSSLDQSSTSPATHVTVPPPTQIVPESSRSMWTRPARPSAPPWLATYGASTRPVRRSHSARDALRLPVTGSSTVTPAFGTNARTSIAAGESGG